MEHMSKQEIQAVLEFYETKYEKLKENDDLKKLAGNILELVLGLFVDGVNEKYDLKFESPSTPPEDRQDCAFEIAGKILCVLARKTPDKRSRQIRYAGLFISISMLILYVFTVFITWNARIIEGQMQL